MMRIMRKALLLFVVLVQSSNADQRFAIEAEDVTAVVGSTVTLPCRVVQREGVLQWTRDDFGLGLHRNLSAFDRYSMIGSDEEGDYSLRIESVQVEDDARFQCQVSPGPEGQPGIRSRFVRLTVLVPADAPRITQGDYLLVTENNEIEIECISAGGKPAADLTWIDGNGNGITMGIRYSAEPMADDPSRFVAKSLLRLRVQKQHHNTSVLCRSQNAADRHFRTAELHIEVKYAPKLKMLVLRPTAAFPLAETAATSAEANAANEYEWPDKERTPTDINSAVEGQEVRFVCLADANPSDITYKWFINNELVIGDYTTEMVVHNVNRSHHRAAVKCEATNDIGFNEASLLLQVKYPPVFRQPLRSVEADAGERIKLFCDVDGNPQEIVWVHDPVDRSSRHPRVVGTNATLSLAVTSETIGRYFCKANVPGYAEIQAEAMVYLKRAPQIESPRQQFGARGDTIRLRCAAFSVPKARHVSWSYNGREIQTLQDRDFGVEEDHTGRGIMSTLVIRRSEEWHFGKYNCTVVNDYGVDVLQIELVQQSNFQLLLIVVGATSALIVLVVIVVLCMCVKANGKRDTRSPKEKAFGPDMLSEKHDGCWTTSSSGAGGSTSSSDGSAGTSSAGKLNGGSDANSFGSDYKPDIKAGSSESDYSLASTNMADSTLDFKAMRRNGSVPLAEPIELPISYRHSVDYADSFYPPKYAPPATSVPMAAVAPNTNNSYVTRTDYARYCVPQPQTASYMSPVPAAMAPMYVTASAVGRTAPHAASQQLVHAMRMMPAMAQEAVLGTRSSLIV